MSWSSRRSTWWLIAISLLYLLFQAPTLGQPILEATSFRQTQTAYQIETLYTGEGSIFNPVLPVFGEPWEVPFEMPVFQASAGLLMYLLNVESDVAARSASLIWFLLCLFPFWSLSRRFLDQKGSLLALLIFLFAPISILYSRAGLIEFAAIFFSLMFISLFLKAIEATSFRLAVLASVFAALGGATKSTTFIPAAMVALALFVLTDNWRQILNRANSRSLARLILPLAVGFIAMFAWTSHADSVKRATPATAWLTSDRLFTWNFGTIDQRLDLLIYRVFFDRFQTYFGTITTVILLLSAPLIFKRSPASRLALVSFGAILFSILVFFNLYVVHDYYFVAVLPFVALLAGSVVSQIVDAFGTHRFGRAVWAFLILLIIGIGALVPDDYWRVSRLSLKYDTRVASVVPESSYVIVAEDTWDPTLLYSNRRRGIMMDRRAADVSYLKSLPDLEKYDYMVGSSLTPELLGLRGYFAPLEHAVFRIEDRLVDLREFPFVLSYQEDISPGVQSGLVMTCDGVSSFTPEMTGPSSAFIVSADEAQRIKVNGYDIPVTVDGLVITVQSVTEGLVLMCNGGGSASLTGLSDNS